jgi:cytochrome c oxidase assembly protein subunit 15
MAAGLSAEFASDAPALLRLRLVHPFVAVATGIFLAWIGFGLLRATGSPSSRRAGAGLVTLVTVQFVAGVTDVLLLAPIWLQLVHLLLANALWIVLVVAVLDDRTCQP